MHQQPDLLELVVGMIRPLCWAGGVFVTLKYKNWFACVGCILFVYTSSISSLSRAGYYVYHLEDTVTYVSTPGVIFMVAGMVFSMRAFLYFKRTLGALEEEDLTKDN